MKDPVPQPVRLAEYAPPNWLIDEVHLTFRLDLAATRVLSRIAFRPNPARSDRTFRLDGKKLQLIRAMVDGAPVSPRVDAEGLSVAVPDAPFVWECEVEIDPSANTELEGLYLSKGLFCTQCEAEGFRKITFFPDRPDVMATYTVRIEGDAPVLLSNGNPVASGPGWAEWHDPWPKPSYLFALVAGDLVAHSGRFATRDGRDVDLNIWVRAGDEDRCAYALDSLERSMRWDEEVYGRVYDLDVFNLVAVDDFNAGAMENKGLNIFNSKYVLASPETATDRDFEFIEGIVAHEYFHNWTGNRITCRDWFQLCLKEGLTVFRDQQFSGDMRGHAVKRIDDVLMLRARQFREDAGPLAHSVRPEEYFEINNFYTATVYEKGAEVIGMLKTLVGDENYYDAADQYFADNDGQAATIEDWLYAFRGVSARDLSQFKLWYSQAGTPRVKIETLPTENGWAVHASQMTPPTPGQDTKENLVIPIRIALFDRSGAPIGDEEMHVLDRDEETLMMTKGPDKPIVSALRGFSAPVILDHPQTLDERLVLLAHDTDPFNRWEAGRSVAKDQLIAMIDQDAAVDGAYLEALGRLIGDETLDPAFRAFALGLPSEDDLAQSLFDAGRTPDPARIHAQRKALALAIGRAHAAQFVALYEAMESTGGYSADAASAGRRGLRLEALAYVSRVEGPGRAAALFASADNMTESLGALGILLRAGAGQREAQAFYDRWSDDPNTLDKWFSARVVNAAPEDAVSLAEELASLDSFDHKTPNRFRALIGGLAGNTAGFHHKSGAGYRFVAKWLKTMDGLNPMTAARMASVFETWKRYDGDRQGQMQDALHLLLDGTPSKDMTEIAGRMLGEPL